MQAAEEKGRQKVLQLTEETSVTGWVSSCMRQSLAEGTGCSVSLACSCMRALHAGHQGQVRAKGAEDERRGVRFRPGIQPQLGQLGMELSEAAARRPPRTRAGGRT